MYEINLQSPVPLYEQVYKKIISLVISGKLEPDEKIPSVRALAKDLCINPNTISKAYLQLENDKVIYSLAGRGSFVAEINLDDFRNKILDQFDDIIKETINMGITKDELINYINKRWECV